MVAHGMVLVMASHQFSKRSKNTDLYININMFIYYIYLYNRNTKGIRTEINESRNQNGSAKSRKLCLFDPIYLYFNQGGRGLLRSCSVNTYGLECWDSPPLRWLRPDAGRRAVLGLCGASFASWKFHRNGVIWCYLSIRIARCTESTVYFALSFTLPWQLIPSFNSAHRAASKALSAWIGSTISTSSIRFTPDGVVALLSPRFH